MPALSPDGKRVAFAWTGPNATDPYGVYIKKIGEDGAQPITDMPPGASDSNPVWTPDGRFILFFRRFGDQSGIYRVPEQGGTAQLLKKTRSMTARSGAKGSMYRRKETPLSIPTDCPASSR